MQDMLFGNWSQIVRTVVTGVCAYAALVLLLRISGKRTLAKLNAFDFVVTIALGSCLATVLLSRDVSLIQGIVALSLLIGLQYAVAEFSVHSERVQQAVRSEPRLMVHEGVLLKEAMREERITRSEVLAALRSKGVAELSTVQALILETDGSFSVIQGVARVAPAVLEGVRRPL